MEDLILVADDGVTEKTYIDSGVNVPGTDYTVQLGLKGNGQIPTLCWWQDMVNHRAVNKTNSVSGQNCFPVNFARIIKRNENDVFQKSQVAKEDPVLGKLTKVESRGKCFRYNSSTGQYTDFSTGNITFMQTATDYVIFGIDEWVKNLYINITTPGVYAGSVEWEISDGEGDWSSLPSGSADGTAGLTAPGNVYLGDVTQLLWKKQEENAYKMLYLKAKFSVGTVITTPPEADEVYWNYVYDTPYPCLFGNGTYYNCDNALTSIYAEVTPAFEYCNMGRVVFDTDPLGGDVSHDLRADYYYKNPPPGLYSLVVQNVNSTSGQAQIVVNEGSPIGIAFVGNPMYNVLTGMELFFNLALTDGDQADIDISEAMKHIWYSFDGETFVNADLPFAEAIASGSVGYFWVKFAPPVDYPVNKNLFYIDMWSYT